MDGPPFYERFFNEHGDYFDKKSIDQLNLRMRLKLLASVAGESNELAIDYFAEEPTIYLVHRADAAYPLKDLTFSDFVAWFSKFGTWRWYFAFLDKKAEASLNIDLRAELERAFEDVPAEEWAPLLARLPKKKAPGPVRPQGLAATSEQPVVRPSLPSLKQPPVVLDEDAPRGVAFSPDGQRLAVWGANYQLFVYDAGRRERLWKQKHAAAMGLSADGQTVAVLEQPRGNEPADRLVLRACATGKPLQREPWRPGPALTAVACVGGRVVVADTTDTLHVLDLATQRALKTVPRVKNVRRLGAAGDRLLAHIQAYDPGTMQLTGPSAVKLFDLETGAVVTTWAGAAVFAASADGALVALGTIGKRSVVRIVELESGRVLHELQGGAIHPDETPDAGFHLAFSPDGARLVVSERVYDPASKTVTSTVSLFDAKQGTLVERVDLGRDPERPRITIDAEGLALSVDGVLCVAADAYGLRIWQV
ncbi:WD40 repeat domain-containing protein [Nannocystis pusilla]|uniref:WD40 repeat domain-containing protein n=1 Tax=Nannocystis pusilla TaxID=889268 RepID=UPI003B77198B